MAEQHTAENGDVWEIPAEHPDRDARLAQVEKLIGIVRPAIEADGGYIRVLSIDFDSGEVRVELSGACGNCSVAGQTLEVGIDRIFRQRLDWVTKVSGVVEESDVIGTGGWRPF